ncbi:hypothetical protein [Proteus myxofaciens]|uniref:CopG family transcriptional regulator n=1 Tax=Proteus myxofaciens ATCC 19692 TaxID=1354337 RepID=A0A198FD70_9GAMM|nr:hypothetical protein [Proteus myxofaciens]OAT22817.1 hypothetical protein M983_2866 [Proteus myxofaciens ATCC 19692]
MSNHEKSNELTVTLPDDMFYMLKTWIALKQYDSESEAVLEGLKALAQQKSDENRAIKQYFREEVYPEEIQNIKNEISKQKGK